MDKKKITTFPALVEALDKCIWMRSGYDNYDVFGFGNQLSCADLFDAICLLNGCGDKVLKDMADVNCDYKYEAQRMAIILISTMARIPDNPDDLEDFDDERYFYYEKRDIVHNFSYLCKEWLDRLVRMYGIDPNRQPMGREAEAPRRQEAKAKEPQQARATIENGKIVALPYMMGTEKQKAYAVKCFNKAIDARWIITHADGRLSWVYGKEKSHNEPRYLALDYFVIKALKTHKKDFDVQTTKMLFGINPNSIKPSIERAKEIAQGKQPRTDWSKEIDAIIGFI